MLFRSVTKIDHLKIKIQKKKSIKTYIEDIQDEAELTTTSKLVTISSNLLKILFFPFPLGLILRYMNCSKIKQSPLIQKAILLPAPYSHMLATRSSNTLPPSEGVNACTLSGNWAWSNSWLDRDLTARGCANPLVPSGPVGLRITSILKQKAKTNEVPSNTFLVKMQLTVDAGDWFNLLYAVYRYLQTQII